jgi:hypothetical protein
MGRHFFAILEVFSNFAGAPAATVFMTVEVVSTRPSCLQPPTQDPLLFDNKRTLRYKFGISIRLTFFRIRKGEKNESQKLGASRPGSCYLRRFFGPFVR